MAEFRDGDILVIPYTTNDILPQMRRAAAIITEKEGINSHAAIVGLALDKPVIVGAEYATSLLKSGTTVTVDAAKKQRSNILSPSHPIVCFRVVSPWTQTHFTHINRKSYVS